MNRFRRALLLLLGADIPPTPPMPKVYMTEAQLEARLKFWAGIVLVSVFGASMMTILYSLVFVTQPMEGIAPADKQFFKIVDTMTTFLAGSLSTLMTLKATPAVASFIASRQEPDPVQEQPQDAKPD